MKIHFNGRPRQFGCVPVVCLDRFMVQLLNSNDGTNVCLADIHKERAIGCGHFEWMFKSGAKLKVADKPHHFYLYGYHYSGQDILDAAADLVRWDFERRAKLEISNFPK